MSQQKDENYRKSNLNNQISFKRSAIIENVMMLSSQIQTLELEIDTLRKSSNEFEKKKYYNIVKKKIKKKKIFFNKKKKSK